MDDRAQPSDIDVDRDAGTLTVTYLDGYVADFDVSTLRDQCPCATCRNLRDNGQVVWPRPSSPTPLRLENAELHGAWGLLLTWNDGHSTGIYPFDVLRRFHESGAAFGPDSGLGGTD